MEKLSSILNIIKEKFPAQKNRIELLYQHNQDFQSLCADYFSSIRQLNNFQALSRERKQTQADYENIIVELEKELHDFIFPKE